VAHPVAVAVAVDLAQDRAPGPGDPRRMEPARTCLVNQSSCCPARRSSATCEPPPTVASASLGRYANVSRQQDGITFS
jgi:hypothetical protein